MAQMLAAMVIDLPASLLRHAIRNSTCIAASLRSQINLESAANNFSRAALAEASV